MSSQHPPKIPVELASIFDRGDLVAAIAQDYKTHEVLMVAWMNEAALTQTLSTSRVTYWSRSRNELWEKGLTSGHTQKLISLSFDCDGDAVLLQVVQNGSACHTGERSCFYRDVELPS